MENPGSFFEVFILFLFVCMYLCVHLFSVYTCSVCARAHRVQKRFELLKLESQAAVLSGTGAKKQTLVFWNCGTRH